MLVMEDIIDDKDIKKEKVIKLLKQSRIYSENILDP